MIGNSNSRDGGRWVDINEKNIYLRASEPGIMRRVKEREDLGNYFKG